MLKFLMSIPHTDLFYTLFIRAPLTVSGYGLVAFPVTIAKC